MNYKLFFILIFMTSCWERIPQDIVNKYGLDFNNVRKKYILPLITDSMNLTKNREDELYWITKGWSDSSCYYKKVIWLERAKIKSEFNYINGNRRYTTVDGKFIEELLVSYDFINDETIENINYFYRYPENPFGKEISRSEADSLLNIWKIKF